MFQFLFKYPGTVFTKGRFVLLGAWPAWLLPVLIAASAGALALLIRMRLRDAAASLRGWPGLAIWGMQSAMVALILFLLWQPAIVIAELSSQQNIIAVVVDSSRSMSVADSGGKTREAAAIAALEGGLLAGLGRRFQIRVYRLGSHLVPVTALNRIQPVDPATHIGDGLKQLTSETADLSRRRRSSPKRRQREHNGNWRFGDWRRGTAGTPQSPSAGAHYRLRQRRTFA